MLDIFTKMTTPWFNRATFYTGSVGPFNRDFRFRYEQDLSDKEHPLLCAATYSRVCYDELATDVEKRGFPWDDAGVEALKQWFQNQKERDDIITGHNPAANGFSGSHCLRSGRLYSKFNNS